MTEPATTTAAGVAAWKLGLLHKLAALMAAGAIGAAVIAAFDTPKTRGLLFLQALVAGVMAMAFTPAAVRLLDYYAIWIDLTANDPAQWLEVALPAGFLVGCLSWGAVGALVKLRQLVQDRAAAEIGKRVGLTEGE